MPRPPSATAADSSAQLGKYLSFIDKLLDRAGTRDELNDTLIEGLIELGVDAAWIGRLTGEDLIEPERWAGEQIEHYLFSTEVRLRQSPENP
ncbi:MAG: hypothetical protein P8011_06295, partial [Acidihalobacter sp.]